MIHWILKKIYLGKYHNKVRNKAHDETLSDFKTYLDSYLVIFLQSIFKFGYHLKTKTKQKKL